MQKKARKAFASNFIAALTKKSIKVYKKRTKVEEISLRVLHNIYRYIFASDIFVPTIPNYLKGDKNEN